MFCLIGRCLECEVRACVRPAIATAACCATIVAILVQAGSGHGAQYCANDETVEPGSRIEALRSAEPYFKERGRPLIVFPPSFFRRAPQESDIPSLLIALRSANHPVRVYAANALGFMGIGSERVVGALSSALDTREPVLRMAATQALGRLGPAAAPALPEILELLTDEHEPIREAGLEAIEGIGPSAHASLQRMLPDLDEAMRRKVKRVLTRVPNEEPED